MAQKVIMGTLGWHIGYLQPAIDRVEEPDILHFFYGYIDKEEEKKKTIKTMHEMEDACKKYQLDCNPQKVDDIFDFKGMVNKFKNDIDFYRDQGDTIELFNITGGTKPMCAAALFVCMLKNIPPLYIHEKSSEPIDIPLLKTDFLGSVPKAEREIAEKVLELRDPELTNVKLAEIMGKSPSTTNIQVKKLIKKGILRQEQNKDGKSKNILPTDSIELLFG